jgi:hypothetical protein
VSFMTAHLKQPIPSPAILEKIGTAFRGSVSRFAEAEHIPVASFRKGDRKIGVPVEVPPHPLFPAKQTHVSAGCTRSADYSALCVHPRDNTCLRKQNQNSTSSCLHRFGLHQQLSTVLPVRPSRIRKGLAAVRGRSPSC